MNLTLSRHKARAVPEQRRPPQWLTSETGSRTDLVCATCGRRIAFGVQPDRLPADAPFFLEAHRPFCVSGAPTGT
jgi:hypothetical protein